MQAVDPASTPIAAPGPLTEADAFDPLPSFAAAAPGEDMSAASPEPDLYTSYKKKHKKKKSGAAPVQGEAAAAQGAVTNAAPAAGAVTQVHSNAHMATATPGAAPAVRRPQADSKLVSLYGTGYGAHNQEQLKLWLLACACVDAKVRGAYTGVDLTYFVVLRQVQQQASSGGNPQQVNTLAQVCATPQMINSQPGCNISMCVIIQASRLVKCLCSSAHPAHRLHFSAGIASNHNGLVHAGPPAQEHKLSQWSLPGPQPPKCTARAAQASHSHSKTLEPSWTLHEHLVQVAACLGRSPLGA